MESTKQASKVTFLYHLFLPFLCFISNTVMVERSKHLNPQNSIEQEKKEQEDGDTPDLFPGSPAKQKSEERHIGLLHVELYCIFLLDTIIKRNTHDSNVLQNVRDAGARKLETEVDPEGPDHNKCSGDSQHSPWRHLIHKLCYFKHLKQIEINC